MAYTMLLTSLPVLVAGFVFVAICSSGTCVASKGSIQNDAQVGNAFPRNEDDVSEQSKFHELVSSI